MPRRKQLGLKLESTLVEASDRSQRRETMVSLVHVVGECMRRILFSLTLVWLAAVPERSQLSAQLVAPAPERVKLAEAEVGRLVEMLRLTGHGRWLMSVQPWAPGPSRSRGGPAVRDGSSRPISLT